MTNPCHSARGFEQARTRSPCMRGISKRPTIECSRLNRAFWPLSKLWSSTEPRSWRSRDRCKSDGTIWSSSTDKLQLKPRTDPRPFSCKSSSQMESTNTCPRRQRTASRKPQISMRRNAKQRQRQRSRPHARRKKRWSWTSLEALRTEKSQRLTLLLRRESTKFCRHKLEATRRDWQSCGRKWPEISARRFPRRDRNKGSANRRRTSEISIVTINGNFWTTHAEWMAQVGPRHLVLGQEHRLEAGRCDEEAAPSSNGRAGDAASRQRSATR